MIWARSCTGKLIPLDVEPVVDGNVVLQTVSGELEAVVDPLGDPPRYKSHFVTCPNAKQHRR